MSQISAAVLGSSGNVGTEIVKSLLRQPQISRIILFNRKKLEEFSNEKKIE